MAAVMEQMACQQQQYAGSSMPSHQVLHTGADAHRVAAPGRLTHHQQASPACGLRSTAWTLVSSLHQMQQVESTQEEHLKHTSHHCSGTATR